MVSEILSNNCQVKNDLDPCAIVILGATGDLASRKLFPALFDLYISNSLPSRFLIMGCGRTESNDEKFRAHIQNALLKANRFNASKWDIFAKSLFYRPIAYDNADMFQQLSTDLKKLDHAFQTKGNRIFYLALPPALYAPVARMIGQAGLNREQTLDHGWSRLVVEKPFGRDLKSAVELDRQIHQQFQEHQIFRIDHYLAKETVQNILMFRFANTLFEPIWNRRYIDHIRITAAETLGVEHRAGYYEQAGVLRDMFQNHMMQLLALTAMEAPPCFESNQVRDEKVKVFRSLRPFPTDHLENHLILAQYDSGTIQSKRVPAYRDEPGVQLGSLTPTYAMMKVFIDNWRWQGVPFYLISGKRLKAKQTDIVIQFKEIPHSIFRKNLDQPVAPNRLFIGIYPKESIRLTFQTKQPGATICLGDVTMDFDYDRESTLSKMDAYAKVLIDCMSGDQMLFWRQDGIETAWSFLSPILDSCKNCSHQDGMPHFYKSGSLGPMASIDLLP